MNRSEKPQPWRPDPGLYQGELRGLGMANDSCMDDYEYLNNVVEARDLLKRWQGILEIELGELVASGKLPAYWARKRLWNETEDKESTSLVSVCLRLKKLYSYDDGYDLENIVFTVPDIMRIENEHPEYTWRIANVDLGSQSQSKMDSANEWISCDTLASRWGWSPFDVVDLIKSGELRYNIHYGSWWEPDVSNLSAISVYVSDLISWEVENAHRINNAPVLAEDGERLRQEIKSLKQENADLKARNATLRLELEARPIIPPKPPEPPKPPRTAAASKAATEKKVEGWKRHAACMVKVAVECCAQGPRKRKRPELRSLAKKHGGKFPEVALDILRDALPEEHVSRDAGPSRQD